MYMKTYIKTLGKVFLDKYFAAALVFVLSLYVFEEWAFDSPQGQFLKMLLTFDLKKDLAANLIVSFGSFVFCFLFVLFALRSPNNMRWIYGFAFGLSTLIQYGFWKAVKRFILEQDLQIAGSTPLNIWMGAGALYFNWIFILPLAAFVFLLFSIKGEETRPQSLRSIGVLLALIVSLGGFAFMADLSVLVGPSLPAYYGTIAQFGVNALVPSSRQAVEPITNTRAKNNILLIVDESIRGDHLGINGYSRDTTPYLSQIVSKEGIALNFGVAAAGGTCSYISNSLLITGVRPGSDDFKLVHTHPTVFQYARAMGYKTYYLDVQASSLWNGLKGDDLRYVDFWYKVNDFEDGYNSDFRAAEQITDILSESTGNFIMVNKRGVHFLYEGSYAPDAEIWGPTPDDYTKQPDLVVNAYDNGIRYNLDNFFRHLLPDLSILDTTYIIYTSDHGETLFEDGTDWLHCNNTIQEARVPLLILGKHLPTVETGFQASHSNILPTLLDLMDVPNNIRRYPYAPSLFSDENNQPVDVYFFDGALRLVDFQAP